MKPGFQKINWALALSVVVGSSLLAETAEKQQFETSAFLKACTDLVPNVPLAIPMDAQCISQGRKMCELAFLNVEPEKCLEDVTTWMRAEADSKWSHIPEDIRLERAKPPTASELANDEAMAVIGGSLPSCETVHVEGVSQQQLCKYSDALAGWHALRILQRSASEINR